MIQLTAVRFLYRLLPDITHLFFQHLLHIPFSIQNLTCNLNIGNDPVVTPLLQSSPAYLQLFGQFSVRYIYFIIKRSFLAILSQL